MQTVARKLDSMVAGPTIRVAMLLSFGVTLGIWALAGLRFTAEIGALEDRASTFGARYMEAQHQLSAARGRVLLASVFVRDALLEGNPAKATEYVRRVEDTYRRAGRALQRYVPVLDSADERASVLRLRNEIDAFRAEVLQVLATDMRQWRTEVRSLLRARVMPKRDAVLRLSEELQALNRRAFVEHQSQLAQVYNRAQRRTWRSIGLALAASLCVALIAILYVGRLEGQLRRHRATLARDADELQRLSSKLITAQEEERRTIAREIHDEIGQVLTAVKVELAVAQRAVAASGGPPDLLDEARTIADGGLQAARDLSHLLHPALLDDLGLAAAVEWYARGFARRHGIRCDVMNDGKDERLSPAAEATAYRIVQEALTNVARHSGATECRISIVRRPGNLLLSVEDNGAGFDASRMEAAGGRRGLGLVGIRERVHQLRGTMRLESGAGSGTSLTVELRVPAASATTRHDALEEEIDADTAPYGA